MLRVPSDHAKAFAVLHYPETPECQSSLDDPNLIFVTLERFSDSRLGNVTQGPGYDFAESNKFVKGIEVEASRGITFIDAKPVAKFLFVLPISELRK
jgi:hypothetical protein